MVSLNKITKCSKLFFLYSSADLKENLSLRILHSLIPTLLSSLSSEQEIQDWNYFLAHDLIPGAKEILNYGLKAISQEYKHSYNDTRRIDIQSAVSNGDYDSALYMAIQGFPVDFTMVPGISSLFGGQPWADFSQGLLNLKNQIQKTESSKSRQDVLALTAYLNAIDGLVHNTGSFMEKLVSQEGKGQSPYALLQLRNLTRLPVEQVIALLPFFFSHPYYKRFLQEYLRLHPASTQLIEQSFQNLYQSYPNPNPPTTPFIPKKPPPPPRPAQITT